MKNREEHFPPWVIYTLGTIVLLLIGCIGWFVQNTFLDNLKTLESDMSKVRSEISDIQNKITTSNKIILHMARELNLDIDSYKNLLGYLAEGEVKIIWQHPQQMPNWVLDIRSVPNRKPDMLYFVGTFTSESEAKALDSALDNAASEISKYLFETVDDKLYFSDKLRNSVGFVLVQALTHDTVGKHISTAITKMMYPGETRENFIRFCESKEYGAIISYYDVKRLVAFPKSAAQESLKQSRDEIQMEIQKERDEVKKELLVQSAKMLEAMENEISSLER